jgi:ABC-type Fe3+ transport system permease subunit
MPRVPSNPRFTGALGFTPALAVGSTILSLAAGVLIWRRRIMVWQGGR